jgi:sugar transferase (PEP-CTERM system associated)
VIRIFNVYYPVRTLVLIVGEALMVVASLFMVTVLQFREDSFVVLNFENGYAQIVGLAIFVMFVSYWFDLYEPSTISSLGTGGEAGFQTLFSSGVLVSGAGLIGVLLPSPHAGRPMFLSGLDGSALAVLALLGWHRSYTWLLQQPFLQQRVYVLGADERARTLVNALLGHPELGVHVVGWSGQLGSEPNRDAIADHLIKVATSRSPHRIIVAMQDRRNTMPIQELLELRLRKAIYIEEAASWLERISGKIEIAHLFPSWIIYADGFRFTEPFRLARRTLNLIVGVVSLILTLPLLPLVALAIRIDSPGPVLYRQRRVGRNGHTFFCYKFRTMRENAEADCGPTWAGDDDPRITRVGRVLRMSRLDEIPQLWCVVCGDMALVGPRPERPEFVAWLEAEIPYYGMRHLVRPGITGWAQVRYKYGNSLEDAREKLQYDLFYLKNASMALDLLILFHTIKTVLLRRGAQ